MFKEEMIKNLKERKIIWKKKHEEKMLRNPERKAEFSTDSEIVLDTVYTADNVNCNNSNLELPGEYPYTRGVQPNM
ncbi:MAG: hypothetical protein HGA27_03870 [Peptococcaceae bacterium]|nr:hypothetical protein [Peptococcaceae bacterium]